MVQSFSRVTKPKTREIRRLVDLCGTSNGITPQQSPSFSTQTLHKVLSRPCHTAGTEAPFSGLDYLAALSFKLSTRPAVFPSFLSIAPSAPSNLFISSAQHSFFHGLNSSQCTDHPAISNILAAEYQVRGPLSPLIASVGNAYWWQQPLSMHDPALEQIVRARQSLRSVLGS